MRLILRRLLTLFAALMLAGSLVSLPASGFWALEMFAHFRVQYVFGALLLLPAAFLLGDRRSLLTLLAGLMLNAALVGPWLQGRDPVAGDGRPVRILHLNVHSSNDDYARTLDFIAGAEPDIVVLQEVTPRWQAAMQALHDSYPYGEIQARAGSFGIALLSRLPLTDIRHTASPPFGYPTVSARLEIDGRTTTLVSTHPTIPLGGELFRARNTQLSSIADLLAAAPGRRVLVGDLNASLWDPRLIELTAASGLVNARQGFGIRPSWPTFLPVAMIPIDHVLASPDVEVLTFEAGTDVGSDHLPLLVTLAL